MSKINDKEVSVRCRLCSSTEEGQVQIFGAEGESRNLAKKIGECLPIVVDKDDHLPGTICMGCVQKLEDFHSFRQMCIRTESSFKDAQQSPPLGAEFPLEPECCLQEMDQPRTTSIEVFPSSPNPTVTKLIETQGSGDLEIMPVIKKENILQRKDRPWSRVGQPTLEDYVLMLEETFMLDAGSVENKQAQQSPFRLVASGQIEFHSSGGGSGNGTGNLDKDILLAQRRKREVLPPMWDVYERGKENRITHRRYIISKGAFPCSLCKRCFAISQGFDREWSDSGDQYEEDENSSHLLPNSKTATPPAAGTTAEPRKFFNCSICCKVFPRRSSLKRHQRTHLDRKPFTCPLCQKGFNRKEHLSRHMISHSGGRPYNCDICFKPFTRKEHLSRHRLCHLPSRIYMRQNVTAPPANSESSSGKGNDESPSAEAEVPDASCAVTPLAPLGSVKQEDDVARPFVCDLCGQGFARKEHLLRHQIRTHHRTAEIIDELKPYNCNVCHKNFTRKEHLVRHQKIHMRELFTQGTPHGSAVIPGTDVSLSLAEPLEGVIPPGLSITALDWGNVKTEPPDAEASRTANNASSPSGNSDEKSASTKPQNTSVLAAALSTPFSGTQPVLPVAPAFPGTSAPPAASIEVPRKHPCEYCPDKLFSRRSHLLRHFKRLHADKPINLIARRRASSQEMGHYEQYLLENGQYLCIVCNKTFGRRYHLVRHMKLHGPNEVAKPFHCSACSNSFSRHEYFQSHRCKVANKEIAAVAADKLQESETSPEITENKDERSPETQLEEISDKEIASQENLEPASELTKIVAARREKRKKSKCNYECVTCGKGFSKKKFLNRHSEQHEDLSEDMTIYYD